MRFADFAVLPDGPAGWARALNAAATATVAAVYWWAANTGSRVLRPVRRAASAAWATFAAILAGAAAGIIESRHVPWLTHGAVLAAAATSALVTIHTMRFGRHLTATIIGGARTDVDG